jgi:NADPH:quinone reductase-like Zn-dependent oxidoreductase
MNMRAYVLERYGGAGSAVLRDWPIPAPARGEVRVRVQAVGLNPVDYKIRQGVLRAVYRYPLPLVLGNELAGVVEANGAGATRFAPGERVIARVAKETLGAFAQYACVAEELLAAAPATLDAVHAAALPLAGLTAWQALTEELHCGPGQQLLITGGAGGVGSFALPLARALGAQVTTSASPRGRELVERLGAQAVIDYTRERLDAVPQRFDAALDLVGGATLEQCFAAVKRGGRVVSVAGVPEPRTARLDLRRGFGLQALFWLASAKLRARARRHGVDYRYLFMRPDGAQLAGLAARVEAGTLPVTLDRTFAFEQIDAAFAYLEGGRAKGKVVLRVAD